jgi:hypothetical protein
MQEYCDYVTMFSYVECTTIDNKINIYIQGDQKASVYLMITIVRCTEIF